jgi:hypothetical protein
MVGLTYSYKRVKIHKAYRYNTASLVCSGISGHAYCDSPDMRACGEEREKKDHSQ